MEHPFFAGRAFRSGYAVWFALFAAAQSLAFAVLTEGSWAGFAVDAAVTAAVCGGAGILLWYPLRYTEYPGITHFRRFVNEAACSFLYAGLCAGAACLAALSVGDAALFIRTLPMRAILFLFVSVVLGERYKRTTAAPESEEAEPAVADATACGEVLERIAVRSGQRVEVIAVGEIISLLAEGDYVMIYTMQGRHIKEQTMKYFASRLPAGLFVRVHRSSIVNIGAISGIELYGKQQQRLRLRNGQYVVCSQEGYRLLKSRLGL